jgi:hypothetical protein
MSIGYIGALILAYIVLWMWASIKDLKNRLSDLEQYTASLPHPNDTDSLDDETYITE